MPGALEPGEDARRLFDIVGLDEGTCGRRPGLPKPLGSGWSVKSYAVPMGLSSKLRFRSGCSYVQNANTPVCDFVQEWLPEMPVLLSGIPPEV